MESLALESHRRRQADKHRGVAETGNALEGVEQSGVQRVWYDGGADGKWDEHAVGPRDAHPVQACNGQKERKRERGLKRGVESSCPCLFP